jgi:hypothetical protein
MSRAPGIYVERFIRGTLPAVLDETWRLTQSPEVHQRWDLRFTTITYLPCIQGEPQRFLYRTALLPGLAIKGTGESVGERRGADGAASSALMFASQQWFSLIEEGSGYWRYLPVEGGLRFLTWYDYRVRFGLAGRLLNTVVLRPAMGWATAWSFDRLALWVEQGQSPEMSLTFAAIHAIARIAIAFVWIWHGLIPKLLFQAADEQRMLLEAGLSVSLLPWFGAAEILFGFVMLASWRFRSFFLLNIAFMAAALMGVLLKSPEYLTTAFNPVTLNLLVAALATVGYLAAGKMPTASRCLRMRPKGEN